METIITTKFETSKLPAADWRRALWPEPESILRRLGLEFGMPTVDLCCGDGHFTTAIAHIVGGLGRVVGLDIDPDILAIAKQQVSKYGIPDGTVRWLESDVSQMVGKLPMPPQMVFMANTLHSIENKQQLARDVYAVLKPGGQFVVINWHHRLRDETLVLGRPRGPKTALRLSPDQVMEDVLPAGFNLHGVIELPPYHYGVVFDKPKAS